jgi:tetratricopeptide (TPR) repeat protein
VDALTTALYEELPEIGVERLRAAVERATAKLATAQLNTAGHELIYQHLVRVEASEESSERARILRDLAENLEHDRGDADRALVVRLAAFGEVPGAADITSLLRLARVTRRWADLPLDHLARLVDPADDAAPAQLIELARAWQQRGDPYRAADCLERVLAIAPADRDANDELEVFYRKEREWPVLVELLARRALHVDDRRRAELLREIAVVHERELGDDRAAFDAYREADQLDPDRADVLDAIARLALRLGESEDEALRALERAAALVADPKQRAPVLVRAAEIARHHDWTRCQTLFERARVDDPDLASAVDGFVTLLRDRGQLAESIVVLLAAAERPTLAAERSRWLNDAADFCVASADFPRAMTLYRQAREADPTNAKAGAALVELCWDTGSLVELAPILDELIKTTHEPGRLRQHLLARRDVAQKLGDAAAARAALARAVELDPHDPVTRRDLADLAFEACEWKLARELIEGLLDDHEDLLQTDVSVELHYRVARCAHELGDRDAAAKHAAVTLALAPDHRPALLLRGELDVLPADAQLADMLALANTAPAEEKGPRFAVLGDRYAERGDRATAREMYREALRYRGDDHLVLTKFLGLIADEGDWSYSLDLVQRLIDSEQDRKVRARYRHLAAMIARDELLRRDAALGLFDEAIDDDPLLFTAADELEEMLEEAENRDALMAFYYRRLGHVRDEEGRKGERLRLWDKLGELCLDVGRHEDAVTTFEVGVQLDPDNIERRQRLADLYLHADAKHDAEAIAQHHAVLRLDKRRVSSYESLRALYRRTGQAEKARACDEALAIVGKRLDQHDGKIEQLFQSGRAATHDDRGARRALADDDWLALARVDVDLQLTGLFALVAAPYAAERARLRPPPEMPLPAGELPPRVEDVLARVARVFGIARPMIGIDRAQPRDAEFVMRLKADGRLAPLLVVGKPVFAELVDDRELAFVLARALADLRGERAARLLCPRASDLAQIIELAIAPAAERGTPAARWLTTSLHPVELDQAIAIGARLRERGIDPARAARDWLIATERGGDRIGLVVVGELAPCVRAIERESPGEAGRVAELVWASITEDVLAVRARVEGWAGDARPRDKRARTAPVA